MNNEGTDPIAVSTQWDERPTAIPCASQYLREQTRRTSRELLTTITDLKQDAARVIHPAGWLRHHPAACTTLLLTAATAMGIGIFRRMRRGSHDCNCGRAVASRGVGDNGEHNHAPRGDSPGVIKSFLGSELGRATQRFLFNSLIAMVAASRLTDRPEPEPETIPQGPDGLTG